MTAREIETLEKAAASGDVEATFELGLYHWEKCKLQSDFDEAKELIGTAKRMGHPLGGMYWDIICAFEEAAEEERG